ncbi:MAG: hypothetical protein DI538_26985 [Azospira oryzae]|nr:MAG: hypothetical protein DI538_26985 [Azospira oryzae]
MVPMTSLAFTGTEMPAMMVGRCFVVVMMSKQNQMKMPLLFMAMVTVMSRMAASRIGGSRLCVCRNGDQRYDA